MAYPRSINPPKPGVYRHFPAEISCWRLRTGMQHLCHKSREYRLGCKLSRQSQNVLQGAEAVTMATVPIGTV